MIITATVTIEGPVPDANAAYEELLTRIDGLSQEYLASEAIFQVRRERDLLTDDEYEQSLEEG